ncbi:Amino acid decarboxylase [Gammaproteobacteria bacterium]
MLTSAQPPLATLQQLNQLRELQTRSAGLEPNDAERKTWQLVTDRLINQFLDKLPVGPAFTKFGSEVVDQFNRDVAQATSFEALLSTVEAGMVNAGLVAASPGHLGFVPGGGLYIGAVADHFAASINAFSADAFTSPIAVHIHEQVMQWLIQVIGYGKDAWGDITSGGSQATLTAFYVAREVHRLRPSNYHKTCVYISEHTHHCCEKALRILFSKELVVRRVSLKNHVIDSESLSALVQQDQRAGLIPWMIVATAGSTNLGRVDPLLDLATITKKNAMWLHVDAAYGGMFKLCEAAQTVLIGLENADSVVLDPHKGLFLPYGCGVIMFKQGEQLRKTIDYTGNYLQDRRPDEQHSPMDYSLELTRPFRSLRIWLALKTHGQSILADALNEKLLLAAYCRNQLRNIKYLVMVGHLDLSIFAFRYEHPACSNGNLATKQLLEVINAHGDVFLTSTMIDDYYVIRVAVLSFRTHLETIDKLIALIKSEVALLTSNITKSDINCINDDDLAFS